MKTLSGSPSPWFRRLDHLICEVPDIDAAMERFTGLGFPVAWPIGRFWPQGRTAGVALGGFNLEFLEPDRHPPEEPWISTLVFEPTSFDEAKVALTHRGVEVDVFDKWETDPERLRQRGYPESEAAEPQRICRNLYPKGPFPIAFFVCDYAPHLRARLSPEAFSGVPPVDEIVLGLPHPETDAERVNALFGLPSTDGKPRLRVAEAPRVHGEVIEFVTPRGPIDLGGWTTRFRFT